MDNVQPNPFMPSFGRFPKIVIDQQTALEDYLQGLTTADAKYQTSLVYGTRGSGKTVFLLNVQRSLRDIPGWSFVRLNNGQGNLLFQLLHSLQKIAGVSVTDLLKNIQGITLLGNSINLRALQESGQLDYSDLLPPLLDRLKEQKKSVFIGIDEIEISKDVQAFGSMYQTLIGQDYPLNLLMAGLPSRISEVQNDDMLTFLLRANRVYLLPLDNQSVSQRYEQAFLNGNRQIDYHVLDQMVNSVKGYAYAFQTLGYYAWRYSQQSLQLDSQVYQQAVESTRRDLFRNAYERMYLDISNGDRRFTNAIAEIGGDEPVSVSKLSQHLKIKPNYLSVYRARLLYDQLIRAPRRGFIQLSLPFFAEFTNQWRDRHALDD